MNATHPIIAGHVEAFDEAGPLGQGPLEPESRTSPGILTKHDPKPLSTRQYDWEARHQASYDGAEDSPTRHQIGFGATEQEAIEDLQEQLDDEYAPVATSDDLELEDLRFHRGNDWMTERDVLTSEYGMGRTFR